MSESNKFTPGPWVRSSESPKIIMSGSFIDGHDGYMIGSVTGNDNSGFYASEEEAAANATLMIAAPDLLEALEKALDALAHCRADIGYSSMQTRAAHMADKAIKKARNNQ